MDSPTTLLEGLLTSTGIDFKTPTTPDSSWQEWHEPYHNSRLPFTPSFVILPKTLVEISDAVRHASSAGFKIQARSGGHSYASHSLGGVDGAVVIDLRHFNRTWPANEQDPADQQNIYVAQGGIRLGNLAESLYNQGRQAVPHGTCTSVGIGGHFTHGGFGMLSRAWGLSMDSVVGMTVVMADGSIVEVDKNNRPDIFAAMRGAADSFGIIVNFNLRTQRAPDIVIHWTVNLSQELQSVDRAITAFATVDQFFRFSDHIDRRLGLVIHLNHDRFTLEGTFLGTELEFQSDLLPQMQDQLVSKFKSASCRIVSKHSWLDSVTEFSNGQQLVAPTPHVFFFAKSAVVLQSEPVMHETMRDYFSTLIEQGKSLPKGTDLFIGIQLFGGHDSQISVAPADDCYAWHNAGWVFQHHGSCSGDHLARLGFEEHGMRFIESLNQSLGGISAGASSNYADSSLNREDALRLYHSHKLPRLVELKSQLDPEDVFQHPQTVQPGGS
ncbi:putative glucooligosaccharide oxidase [Astrocystis sublimbata]|nr:putative glucooligosaccharide oxidase [Astrocystis sublimbata]